MQGASQNALQLEWDKLWAVNRKEIDPVAGRHTAIAKEGMYRVVLVEGKDVPAESIVKEMPRHKKNPDAGTKEVVFSKEFVIEGDDGKTLKEGEEITLMDWGNAIVQKMDGGVVEMKLHLAGDYKKTAKKLSWLALTGVSHDSSAVEVTLYDYDYLLNKKKLEENDTIEDCLTQVTEFRQPAFADANVKTLSVGEIIQFERKGFYIVDEAYEASNPSPIKFIHVPDGKAASTVSKAFNYNGSI